MFKLFDAVYWRNWPATKYQVCYTEREYEWKYRVKSL